MLKQNPPKDVDAYIRLHPKEIRTRLIAMRRTIQKAAPKAEEAISYRIPTFRLNGNLVHFAAFTHHIGFYPTSSGIAAFRSELAPYKTSQGAVQFPLDQALPLNLVADIVRFRVKETMGKIKGMVKRAKKTPKSSK